MLAGHRFYAYVVVDSHAASVDPLALCFSRREARQWIENDTTAPDTAKLRIRRAIVSLFPS